MFLYGGRLKTFLDFASLIEEDSCSINTKPGQVNLIRGFLTLA